MTFFRSISKILCHDAAFSIKVQCRGVDGMSYAGSLEEKLEARGFDYPAIIRFLSAEALADGLSPVEQALLGMSYLRTARLSEAEVHLQKALVGLPPGDNAFTEVLLELAGVRLAALQPQQAEALLAQIALTTSPWLNNMLLRRRANLCIVRGDILKACTLYDQAWQGFIAANLPRGNALTGFYLGAVLTYRGEFERAEKLLEYTIKASVVVSQPALLFDALSKKIMLLILQDKLLDAQEYLEEMKNLKSLHDPSFPLFMSAVVLMNEIVLAKAKGQHTRFLMKITQLGTVIKERPHPEMIYWLGPIVLDSLSKLGRHDQARQLLKQSLPKEVLPPVNVRLVEAIIFIRTGQARHAAQLLSDIVEEARDSGLRLDYIRAQLHLANALFKSKQHLKITEPLIEGLKGLVSLRKNFLIRDDLISLKSLLKWGRHQDEIRLYIDLLDSSNDEENHLVIQAFGGLKALLNGQPLNFRLDEQEILLLLAYIYKHPNCTYAELASEVLSEKAPHTGTSYARQAVMLLRQQLGEDRLITLRDKPNHPARLRLENLKVTFDVDSLFESLEHRDIERLAMIYQGRLAPRSTSLYAEKINRLVEEGVNNLFKSLLASRDHFSSARQVGRIYPPLHDFYGRY